jgi:hypothetical protein
MQRPPADQQAATRISAVFVQTLAHFFARLEVRHPFGRHCNRDARARIATGAAISRAGGKRTKATKFDSAAICETIRDRIEDQADDLVDFLRVEFRIAGSKLLYELRSYHDAISLIGQSLSILLRTTTTSHPNVIVSRHRRFDTGRAQIKVQLSFELEQKKAGRY